MNQDLFNKMTEGLDKAFPFVDLGLTLHGQHGPNNYSHVVLDKIVIDPKMRKQGYGTLVMETLISLADRYGLLLSLTPDTVWGATSKNRLRKFYKRFGFVNNKGRNKDFTISDGMYRFPSNDPSWVKATGYVRMACSNTITQPPNDEPIGKVMQDVVCRIIDNGGPAAQMALCEQFQVPYGMTTKDFFDYYDFDIYCDGNRDAENTLSILVDIMEKGEPK